MSLDNNNEKINNVVNNISELNNNTLNTSSNINANLNINNYNHNQSEILNHNNQINNILNSISSIHDISQNINNSFNYSSNPNNINIKNLNNSLLANNNHNKNNLIDFNNNDNSINPSLQYIQSLIPQNNHNNNSYQNIEFISLEQKAKYIISIINKIISTLNLYPILNTMKKEPMLYKFYKNRILEIISEKLSDEREKIINNLQKQNNQLNNDILIMRNKFNDLNKCSNEEKEKILKSIKNLEKELEIKTEKNTKLFDQIESMTSEINMKNQQIIFFQNNIENIRIKQDEMKNYLNTVMEQNSKLTNENKDLYKKLEELKIDYQNNIQNLNNKINLLQKENETVLKVKIQALRNKLKEKVNIINKLTNNTNDICFDNIETNDNKIK